LEEFYLLNLLILSFNPPIPQFLNPSMSLTYLIGFIILNILVKKKLDLHLFPCILKKNSIIYEQKNSRK